MLIEIKGPKGQVNRISGGEVSDAKGAFDAVATLSSWIKSGRLSFLDYVPVSAAVVDEVQEAMDSKLIADKIVADNLKYESSEEYAQKVRQNNQNTAFKRLIGAFTVVGSYPEKQKAMTAAVASLEDTATADELYEEAVKQLG